jgi:hypothetical protein
LIEVMETECILILLELKNQMRCVLKTLDNAALEKTQRHSDLHLKWQMLGLTITGYLKLKSSLPLLHLLKQKTSGLHDL